MLDMLSSTNNKVGYFWVADVGHFSRAPKQNELLKVSALRPISPESGETLIAKSSCNGGQVVAARGLEGVHPVTLPYECPA
jgi:hypothetical protein